MKNRLPCRGLIAALILACASLVAPDALAQSQKKVLVVTVTKGFRHSSIPTAMKVLAELGEKNKAYAVDFAFNDADIATKMTPERLKDYDAIVFANTTGDLPLPNKQAFLDFIKQGKGFVGMHAASDTFHAKEGVDPYIAMLGGEFVGHGAQVGVECLVVDSKHPATKSLGESYCLEKEEIYLLKNFDKDGVHELLYLDRHPNKKSEKGHFPVAWCKKYGEGRVFYTSLGHREDVWENPAYQKHILGGILWAIGTESGDATPNAQGK